jgi:hypothetical protein
MRLATWVFRLAGVYGIVTVAPLYFLEATITRTTGPIGHPEYFYGFVGLCLVWQIFFLMISRDPSRWRPAMPIAVLEKLSFSIPVLVLYLGQRVSASVMGFASIDLLWAVLFVTAFLRTSPSAVRT